MGESEQIRARLEPIAWPEGAGIELSARDDGRPVLAGSRWLVAIVGDYHRHLGDIGRDELERIIREEYRIQGIKAVRAGVAYYLAHRDLFEREHWQLTADRDELLTLARALAEENARLAAALAVLDEYAAAHADYEALPPRPKGGKHETPVIRWQARAVDLWERVAQADRRFAALLAERAALAREEAGE